MLAAAPAIDYSATPRPTWVITTSGGRAELAFGELGLELSAFEDEATGFRLTTVPGHPLTYVRLTGDRREERSARFLSWTSTELAGATQLNIVFESLVDGAVVQITEHVWLANDLPVIRRWITLRNQGTGQIEIGRFHLLDLAIDHDLADAAIDLFSVDAMGGHRKDRWEPGDANFAPREQRLLPGDAVLMKAGAYQERCSWLALGQESIGLVIGLEYDGGAEIRAYDSARSSGASTWGRQGSTSRGVRLLAAPLEQLNKRLAPGDEWVSPGAFVALFDGGWDGASHVTHALIEQHLAPPLPDDGFPYVMFNSWGYAFDTSTESLLKCLDTAAEIGVEVFVADYGWARDVGDWVSVTDRMPLLPDLGRLVRERGMKLGAWMGFANAAPVAPVLAEHPDWRAHPDDWGSFKSNALCLANPVTREWVTGQVIRVVEEYELDYLVHDFELISPCTHPDHDHPPDPGGYHSTMGYNEVLRKVREAHPKLVIENCQGGGRLMTYAMVQLHDTSITSDGPVLRDALARRQALYGASYPFSLRYCDNYMEERPTDMACHSSMIGGPWILMDQMTAWDAEDVASAKRNIAVYKRIRSRFRDARVYHLQRPDGVNWDALQVQQARSGQGILYLFQPPDARWPEFSVALRGLDPRARYRITSGVNGRVLAAAGSELLSGLPRSMPPGTSDILLIDPE